MKKKWLCLLAAFALAFGAMAVRPAWSAAASPLDLEREDCILTVNLEDPGKNDKFGEDLQSAGVVVDVYRVASAVKAEGFDSYTYQFETAFAGLSLSEGAAASDWEALAQQAIRRVLEAEEKGNVLDKETIRLTELASGQIGNLSTGLYLLLAHGESLSPYVVEKEEKKTDENGQENTEIRLATAANSDRYQYSFEPQLVSIPGRPDAESGEGGGSTTGGSTANTGEWLYDMTVNLKPERGPLYGSLELVKTLLSYDTMKDSPIFVFEITAELEGEVVYRAYESLSFTEAGQQRVTLTGIPVGANVTVTEVYGGAGYRVEGPQSQTGITIAAAPEVTVVEFVNTSDDTNKGGHGIRNHFTYTDDGWQWTATPGPVGAVSPAREQEGLQL